MSCVTKYLNANPFGRDLLCTQRARASFYIILGCRLLVNRMGKPCSRTNIIIIGSIVISVITEYI
jgi:hypothetical protein